LKPSLLIAGGSHSDIPIILAAKKMGYRVYTSGNRPEEKGHRYSDAYFKADYSDPEAILRLAQNLKIQGICASANDFSAISASYTAEHLGLPGHDPYETARILHHKDLFRKLAREIGLPVPRAIEVSPHHRPRPSLPSPSPASPWIVKPVDLSGGKGVSKVTSALQLRKALNNALHSSRAGRAVVEEFIVGSNHGYSAILQSGKIVFAFMDDEQYFLNPYLVSGASTSLNYTPELAQKLNRQLEKLASYLHLADGLLHTQLILRNGEPFILEICRRTPGDLYVKLVEYATGFDLSSAIVAAAMGKTLPPFPKRNISHIMRHCVMAEKQGRIDGVEYGSLEPFLFDRMPLYTRGETVSDIMTYKAEIDFLNFGTKDILRRHRDRVHEEIKIRWMK